MKNFLKKAGTVLIILVVFVIGASYIKNKNRDVSKSIKVGVVLPLTGDSAFIGEDMKRGIDLAAEEFPMAEFIYEDSAGNVKTAVSAYQKILLNKPTVIIVAGTGVESIIPIAEENKIPTFLSVSSASGLPQQGEYIFRYFTNADNDAPVMAEYVVEKLGLKKFATLYLQDQFGIDYNEVFSHEVVRRGGEVVVSESFNYGNFDYRSQLTKLSEKEFDALYLIGLDFQLIRALKEMKELGISTQILSLGTVATRGAIEQAGTSIENVYLTAFCTDGSPEEYVVQFQNKYGIYPGFFSEIGYDIVQMLKKASENGREKKNIQQGLLSIKNFTVNTGVVTSDPFGEMIIPMCVKKITGGKIFNTVTEKYSNY
ncbi:MAG: ABC transporter substrate-binding protein [Patescibacteria group bacterium]